MTARLCDLGLIEAADGIRRKRFSAAELTAACIARAERLQPALNTFIHL
jgi:aspartyl-tRNA(Asn)/glutamyl-tRNA(Gln) amidotransferase subunit A